ncbi:MAG: arginine N-succinyltransferase [Nitrospirota bacterium]|nr:arginine N-succinyltransferase [Nitrospirota bacterium]MDH4359710.1 arginine N-succinyltransferase [Nitrospirota bacterium]MDH5574628.1 arginine N-succinyltransferase [Nitrospirota bacterium]
MNAHTPKTAGSTRTFSGKQVIVFIGLAVLATALVTVWWVNQYLFAKMFEPTRLNAAEQQVLDAKMAPLLHTVDAGSPALPSSLPVTHMPLEPEPYSESGPNREIRLTEREVNALLAKDSEMARHMAVDLSDDLLSVKLVVPMNEDMPLVGGKMLKLNFGLALSYENGKPVVAMRGISVGGIPLPSAWWGDIKNTNLVEEYGGSGGFWDQFAKGVEDLKIKDGELHVILKE